MTRSVYSSDHHEITTTHLVLASPSSEDRLYLRLVIVWAAEWALGGMTAKSAMT